ncbi:MULTISPECIES: SDR family oxidoreductase [unclassified Arsukibacterium]|uniref:SDR family oxidoreductase n=1 Tax=unclassified Arsukibacterium TaxID=2635278 RepID=UPI000C41732F|nr:MULTISPECIES: SDR family oxidoreductase [unclassified Arsukibacterium]MAA93586.1 short chain dehydrogenase [Rheinheimera sp.]MBM34280.1 short chain dehydrogenase [Rheinheimera sp.]HAW92272.1 short chain dehydrogenase [Candidatus Azambacteria bacterium]|tara:strand:+ start:10449 stop:11258 length:810 start_codon:yes stop_codon:yes gene_type:complete
MPLTITPLTNKVIWITGASGGIGEALARELAAAGARLILSARRQTELERVRASLANSVSHLILPLDITDSQAISAAVATIAEKIGGLDWLINNAGISQRALITDTSLETERKLFEVDYFAQINLTRQALPLLLADGGGKVVFVSSVAGLVGTQYRGSYSAAKAALHLWANSLRAELFEQGLTVATIFPGFVKTEVSLNALTGDGKALGEMDTAQANAMSAEQFAEKAVKALLRNKSYVVIGGVKEHLGAWISRLSPELLYKMIRKSNVR